jgi:hypothetical protein
MRHNKDILWKWLMEWVSDDLLRFVFPDADQVFDLDKGFDYLDKELTEMYPELDRKMDVRFVDKLVKVFLKDGGEEWVLIHIEIQDKTKAEDRPLFPERMLRYFIRCLDRYRRPVAAIAIFCGPDGSEIKSTYRYEFMGTRLEYSYNAIRILDYTDEELGKSDNPFAWVILAAKHALLRGKDLDGKLLEGKLFIFRKLYENGIFERRKLQAVLKFLDNYVRFEKPETNRIFKERIDEITHKQNTMDIFEAVEEMKIEEKLQEVVRNLLMGTEFSDDKIAGLAGVSIDFVREVKEDLNNK